MEINKAHRRWEFELEDSRIEGDEVATKPVFAPRKHVVELDHNHWTMKRTIKLDGQALQHFQIRSYGVPGMTADDLFEVDGHGVVVHTRVQGITYTYDLAIDGVSVQTGLPLDIHPEVYLAEPGKKDRMPGWAWLFLGLCVVAGIGAIFVGIVVGGAIAHTNTPDRGMLRVVGIFTTGLVIQAVYSIAVTSKEPDKSERSRIMRCALIVGRTGLIVSAIMATATVLFHE